MSEEQTSFKVTDRRLFNPDGTPRDITPEEKREYGATATEISSGTESKQATEPNVSANRAEQQRAASTGPASSSATQTDLPETPEDDLSDRDPASFINFLMSIASNAASALGMIEHPVTHQREVDLELGKHWIDVLGMLQQKTRGNLTSQEQQIIEGLLGDLRMQYVSFADSKAKSARSFSGRDIIGGK